MSSSAETKFSENEKDDTGMWGFFIDVIFSPLNLILIGFIAVVVYKIFKKFTRTNVELPAVVLPKLRKDMTVAELRQYDGTQPDGRVLLAVNGWIFDVTRGRRFYGPGTDLIFYILKMLWVTSGGPYAPFGGKDASRGLATFSVTLPDKEYDDLSDLNSMQMESVKEWEEQFREKYDLVGRLLKPGEEPTNYSDEEPEETDTSSSSPSDKKDL